MLEEIVFKFLNKHYDFKKPLLLALSGGPDSLALLFLLMKCLKKKTFKVDIAHVDHRWRKESHQEAEQLKQLAERLGLAFYLRVLDPHRLEGNLEAASRQERLNFFAELFRQNDYEAVLLAHHGDDHAETVFKRLMEGYSLPFLSGLSPIARVQGVPLWRPLLETTKKSLITWLKNEGLTAFEDATNLDPIFLRGKLRTRIIPQLTQDFGKEVAPTLNRLGYEALEMQKYLDGQIHPYLQNIQHGPFGSWMDLSKQCPSASIELKYLIRKFCATNNFSLTYAQVETVEQLLLTRAANKRIEKGPFTLLIDRQRLFFLLNLDSAVQDAKAMFLLTNGDAQYGIWSIKVEHSKQYEEKVTGWCAVLKGHLKISLPNGQYALGPVDNHVCYPGNTTIRKWWADAKVPAFLWHLPPLLWREDRVCYEFLTDRCPEMRQQSNDWMHLTLTVNRN